MKTLVTILIHLIIGILTVSAQSSTTTTSQSSTQVTVSIDSDTEEESFSRSFVVIDTEENFRVKIRFMESMTSKVKSYLIDQFGEEKMIVDANTYFWKKEIEDEEIYEVRLKGNRLRINIDKDLAPNKLVKKFRQIGKELKSITSREGNS
ncbi:hypothetical protein [Aquimarina sediminis]|uniref:hypothetical protein n=1 Tax=Aquimarina sediminis TaxID=2070536 RepID=UPI000CA0856A|nr:hypothetical protein [Aquimarina sediminis]